MMLVNNFSDFLGDYRVIANFSDASDRVYSRVECQDGKTYMLMDCKKCPHVIGDFLNASDILTKMKVRTPEIFYHDLSNSVAILEDFGDLKLSVFAKTSKHEALLALYLKVTEMLCNFQKNCRSDKACYSIPIYTVEAQLELLTPFLDYYLPKFHGVSFDDEKRHEFLDIFANVLAVTQEDMVLAMMDFHSDNIMILQDGSIGVIDYQDMKFASSAYDLVSLLQDVRLDVPQEIQLRCTQSFINITGVDAGIFMDRYLTCSLQRNTRILGFFARLIASGKVSYERFVPNCRRYVNSVLQNSKYNSLLEFFNKIGVKYV